MEEIFRISHGFRDEAGEEGLYDYNVEVYRGDILYIQGSWGSGIKTLANILAGDCPLKSGRLFINEREVKDYNRNSAFQYQIYTITAERDMVESMTVAENLEAVRYLPFSGSLYSKRKARQASARYLEKEQVEVEADAYLWSLSQKERRKLSILKAKMHGAKLIALDITHDLYEGREAEELCGLIRRANREGITFIILSRYYTMFAEIATRIQLLSQGIDRKEWREVDERVRSRLKNVTSVGTRTSGSTHFLGLYDYEWEMERGLWSYLAYVKEHSREIWEKEIRAEVPQEGCSQRGGTVVIPWNSGACLLKNLSISDNLILPIARRVGKNRLGVIRKGIRQNIMERFRRETGIGSGRTAVGELDRAEQKILSVYRWELDHPQVIILESPYSGMSLEETERLREYLKQVEGKGIRVIYFSKSLEEMQQDCERILITQNGGSAKIATI